MLVPLDLKKYWLKIYELYENVTDSHIGQKNQILRKTGKQM